LSGNGWSRPEPTVAELDAYIGKSINTQHDYSQVSLGTGTITGWQWVSNGYAFVVDQLKVSGTNTPIAPDQINPMWSYILGDPGPGLSGIDSYMTRVTPTIIADYSVPSWFMGVDAIEATNVTVDQIEQLPSLLMKDERQIHVHLH
jgi:hypothetical protein